MGVIFSFFKKEHDQEEVERFTHTRHIRGERFRLKCSSPRSHTKALSSLTGAKWVIFCSSFLGPRWANRGRTIDSFSLESVSSPVIYGHEPVHNTGTNMALMFQITTNSNAFYSPVRILRYGKFHVELSWNHSFKCFFPQYDLIYIKTKVDKPNLWWWKSEEDWPLGSNVWYFWGCWLCSTA